MRSQPMGGPACRIIRSCIPGMTSRQCPSPPVRLARADAAHNFLVGLIHAEPDLVVRRRGTPSLGGCQSRSTTLTPWSLTDFAMLARPNIEHGQVFSENIVDLCQGYSSPAGNDEAGQAGGGCVAVTDDRASFLQGFGFALKHCGSSSVPVTERRPAIRASASLLRLPDGGSKLTQRIGMRTVADDHVQQDDSHFGSRASCNRRRMRKSLSIIGCGRPTVNSSSPRSTAVCW